MSYTFLSARYANPQHTFVVALTQEAGAVAINEADRPVLWQALQESGVPIAPYATTDEARSWSNAARQRLH